MSYYDHHVQSWVDEQVRKQAAWAKLMHLRAHRERQALKAANEESANEPVCTRAAVRSDGSVVYLSEGVRTNPW